jgi:hypothetical protein
MQQGIFNRFIFIFISMMVTSFAFATDRAEELRTEMWNATDKNFKATSIPSKWDNKSAVILAQLNRFEYRKGFLSSSLYQNEYRHYRIKLIDKNAVNKYTEMSYRSNNDIGLEHVKVYAGFKIIKANGKELIVDLSNAVTMEKVVNGRTVSYNKIAIANLESGDILDYYICEESTISSNNVLHFFDPVIYSLPQEYPLIYHKLQFRAERRCFINLRSLNGAPELKLIADDANEEVYYTLEQSELEGIESQRWMYPYRELPSIKFRAAYASGKAMRAFDVLLGKPGVVKSSVTKQEVEDLAGTMLATSYDVKSLSKYAKKKLKGIKDPFEIATQTYYYYRNSYLFDESESNLVEGKSWPFISEIKFVDVFSTFLTLKNIPHDIVIAVPRNIAALDDLLMEQEIEWLIRVKKNDQYLYLSPFSINAVAGEMNVRLEGTDAYALDGLLSPRKWDAKRITLPKTSSAVNSSDAAIQVDLTDLNNIKVNVKKSVSGNNKLSDQYNLLDVYDFEKEERSKFKMGESFTGYLNRKKLLAMKTAYLANRDELRQKTLKEDLETNFDLKIKEVGKLVIEQTGRYNTNPALVYSFNFETEDLAKKAGPNFLIDIGKLIEQQTSLEKEELTRKHNVYFDNARSFKYTITLDVPKGYVVQGLEKLNQRVENKFGGFTSTAKQANGKVTIETNKHFDVDYVSAANWPEIVNFLNAAQNFSEQKLLLKK